MEFFYELGELMIDQEQFDDAQRVFQALITYYKKQHEWYGKVQKKAVLFQTNVRYLKIRNKLDQALESYEAGEPFPRAYSLCREAALDCPDQTCEKEVQAVLQKIMKKSLKIKAKRP